MKTRIISAFPGCGKTYCFNKQKELGLKILDSDSSEFSWLKDENNKNTSERNPDFPNNYIRHIKENIGKCDIIFVSSHEVVRDALIANELPFTIMYPGVNSKEEYLDRYLKRGNNEKFINFIGTNYEKFIKEIDEINSKYVHKVKLSPNQYIMDIIDK